MEAPSPQMQPQPQAPQAPQAAAAPAPGSGGGGDFGAAAGQEAAVRRAVSVSNEGSGVRAYTPTLWQARERQRSNERPKPERDSLRSRSNEGRPGSRKHRRWSQSQDLVRVLQKTYASCGETFDESTLDAPQDLVERRPSVFYLLLEREGPAGALDALAAAEGRRPRSRPRRPQTQAQVEREEERAVRHGFGENWQYVQNNASAKDLLGELESMASRAFSSESIAASGISAAVEEWLLHWDGSTMSTKSGGAPASEMAIMGLDVYQRRFVHQFARIIGLHSQSRGDECSPPGCLREGAALGDGRIITLRPPRHPCLGGRVWAAPLSVARVLRTVA